MIRRSVTILLALALGCGLFAAAPRPTPASAANPSQFTNIGVVVGNGSATYYLCLASHAPPNQGSVAINGPGGSQSAPLY